MDRFLLGSLHQRGVKFCLLGEKMRWKLVKLLGMGRVGPRDCGVERLRRLQWGSGKDRKYIRNWLLQVEGGGAWHASQIGLGKGAGMV